MDRLYNGLMMKWLVLWVMLAGLFLGHYWLVGQAVYGDGRYYWAVARSLWIDHDLDLTNELRHHYSPVSNNVFLEDIDPSPMHEDERRMAFHLPIGVSIAWLPWMAVGELFAKIKNGYSDTYQITTGLGVVVYVTAGLYLVSKLTNWRTTMMILLATNLVYYAGWDTLNSHPVSFMLAAMFLYVWKKSNKPWLMGALIGLMTTVRTQDAIFGIMLLGKKNKLIMLAGFLVAIAPQLLHLPYWGGQGFDWLRPHFWGILTNLKTGIIWSSPILLTGWWGLRKMAWPLRLVVLAQLYIVASWNAWDQAAAYGPRMLISSYPIVALGINKINISKKLLLFFVLLNLIMLCRWQLWIKDETVDMGISTRSRAVEKINRSVLYWLK